MFTRLRKLVEAEDAIVADTPENTRRKGYRREDMILKYGTKITTLREYVVVIYRCV